MNRINAHQLFEMNEFRQELLQLFKDVLESGSALRVKVTGRSMANFLTGGEILTIKKVPCSSLHNGELILFNNHGFPILHRIIKKYRAEDGAVIFQTKGDATTYSDEPVHQDKVLGKVFKIEGLSASGRVRQINMESTRLKALNYFIATITPIRPMLQRTLLNFFIHIHALQKKKNRTY